MPIVESHATSADDGVQLLNPLEIDDWDDQLRHFPVATTFHTSAWARVLHSTYGYKPLYLVQRKSNRFHSLLPVMEVNSWLTGRRGISLPFTDECEPLCSDADSFRHLYDKAIDEATTRAWKYWECRGGKEWFRDGCPSTTYYGHRLVLQGDEAALFSRSDSPVRRAVRKAEQSGLTVEFSQELDAVKNFHALLAKTRQRHGVPVQPWKLFEKIHRHLLMKNLGWVVLARLGSVPVAGAMFFHFGKTAIYKFGASDRSYQHLRANNLVMWEAIKRYARQGLDFMDFGRTSLNNEGLRRFKLSWGTRERQLDYTRYEIRTRSFVTVKDESNRWHSHVFRTMPVFLSRLIGTTLYKHIA